MSPDDNAAKLPSVEVSVPEKAVFSWQDSPSVWLRADVRSQVSGAIKVIVNFSAFLCLLLDILAHDTDFLNIFYVVYGPEASTEAETVRRTE